MEKKKWFYVALTCVTVRRKNKVQEQLRREMEEKGLVFQAGD